MKLSLYIISVIVLLGSVQCSTNGSKTISTQLSEQVKVAKLSYYLSFYKYKHGCGPLDSLQFHKYICEYELDTLPIKRISSDSVQIHLYPITSKEHPRWNCLIQDADNQYPVLIGFAFSKNEKYPQSIIVGTAHIGRLSGKNIDSLHYERTHNPQLIKFLRRNVITVNKELELLLKDEGIYL